MPAKRVKFKPDTDLISATKTGDRLTTLIALRDLLAEMLQNTSSSRDVAAISRRLMQAVNEIEILEKEKQAREENPRSLSDMRRKLYRTSQKIRCEYEVGNIATEHENH